MKEQLDPVPQDVLRQSLELSLMAGAACMEAARALEGEATRFYTDAAKIRKQLERPTGLAPQAVDEVPVDTGNRA